MEATQEKSSEEQAQSFQRDTAGSTKSRITQAEKLLKLFFIRRDAYGLEVLGRSAVTQKAEVTPALVVLHLDGQQRIGAHSTDIENNCGWACADIDHTGHDKPLTESEQGQLHALGPELVRKAGEFGIYLSLEVSKRGGWHVWLFCSEPTPAEVLRRVLRFLLAECGLDIPPSAKAGGPCKAVELFPGQDDVKDGFGNWVYLPYFAGGTGGRSTIVALHGDGNTFPLSLGQFLASIQTNPLSRLQVIADLQATSDGEQPNGHTAREEQHSRNGGTRPGDLYNYCGDIRVLLEKHGWLFLYSRNETDYYRRPGKTHSVSATFNYGGSNLFYVFTSSTVFEAGRSYSKFAVFAILEHAGDFKAAAEELRKKGYSANGDGGGAESEKERTHDQQEQPRPLRRVLPDPEPFPLASLAGLAAPTLRLHETIKAPLALCAQSSLAAVTLAVQPYRNVIIDGRVIPLSENFLTIGESGERKSAVDQEALFPHRAHEKRLFEKYEEAVVEYQNDLAAYKKAREEALKKTKTREAKKQALEACGSAPQEPLLPILLTEEPTYEGLVKLLLRGHPSIGLFADEGGRMIGGYGMNEENELKTAAGLCELWDGRRISRVRGGDGAALLYGRRVSMHLMAQPAVAQRLLGNALMIEQGFLSRCLVACPMSTAGSRTYLALDLSQDTEMDKYRKRIKEILDTPLPIAEGKQNELAPTNLLLSSEAKEEWVHFHNQVEAQLVDGARFSFVRGLANKAPEHVLRLAGVLTLYADLNATEIPVENIKSGILLVGHYLSEALRLFHSSVTDPDLELAEKLLKWAQERGTHVSLAHIYQKGPNAIRDATLAKKLARILVTHGWFVPVEGGMEIDNQFRREVWEVKGEN
jgi:hypothetical protein